MTTTVMYGRTLIDAELEVGKLYRIKWEDGDPPSRLPLVMTPGGMDYLYVPSESPLMLIERQDRRADETVGWNFELLLATAHGIGWICTYGTEFKELLCSQQNT